jgi:DNA uptake protein ComE-like DNA-binding protein/cell division protein FtsB
LKRKLKNYFTFNKKERNGILLLSFVLLVLVVFYQFAHLLKKETKIDFSDFEKEIAALKYDVEKEKISKKNVMFHFNPNTLNDEGWLALGLSKSKLKILRNYQNSGGYFKQKEDLKRCYAFADEFYNIIKEYAIFQKTIKPATTNYQPKTTNQIIELNKADSLTLLSLKGIGPFYAKQIIKYRKELGGFLNYNQFTEIWGLEKLDVEKLQKQTTIDTLYIRKININTVSIEILRNHPYLNYKEAKMIVNFRVQHGNFSSVKDIQKIKPISRELFRKIAPYLKVDD